MVSGNIRGGSGLQTGIRVCDIMSRSLTSGIFRKQFLKVCRKQFNYFNRLQFHRAVLFSTFLYFRECLTWNMQISLYTYHSWIKNVMYNLQMVIRRLVDIPCDKYYMIRKRKGIEIVKINFIIIIMKRNILWGRIELNNVVYYYVLLNERKYLS